MRPGAGRRDVHLAEAVAGVAALYGLVLLAGVPAPPGLRLLPPAVALAGSLGLAWELRRRPGPRLDRRVALPWLFLGVIGGASALPAGRAALALAPEELGLGSLPRPTAATPADAVFALAAPLYEEPIYRGRLLPALRHAVGPASAVAIAALAFALPHGGGWPLLGTFVVGTGLGALALVTRSLRLCIALHLGLNLGALAVRTAHGAS